MHDTSNKNKKTETLKVLDQKGGERMSEEQLLVTLGVKDKGASSQIKELNKEIKSLDSV